MRPAFVSDFDARWPGRCCAAFHAGHGTEQRSTGARASVLPTEIVYRLRQADQRDRLLTAAAQDDADPSATAGLALDGGPTLGATLPPPHGGDRRSRQST